MPFIIIALLQIICGIHAVKSGQDRYWLYLIIALPGIGCTIYVLSIIAPELMGSITGQRLILKAKDKINPERNIRLLRTELDISQTSQNYVHLADELVRLGQYEEACDHYKKALTGIFITDPDIMVKLAFAQLSSGDSVGCQQTLEAVMQANPNYQSQDGHLFYARALTENGLFDKAEEEFKVLISYYTGPEARFRYYQMLRQQGKLDQAREQLDIISTLARRCKPHYRRLHKEWLDKANQEIKTL